VGTLTGRFADAALWRRRGKEVSREGGWLRSWAGEYHVSGVWVLWREGTGDVVCVGWDCRFKSRIASWGAFSRIWARSVSVRPGCESEMGMRRTFVGEP
jgi:hypothetical protein